MEYPTPRKINNPKTAQKLCIRCKSEIHDNLVERNYIYSKTPGIKQYFHGDCAKQFDLENLVYNLIKEARKSVLQSN